MLFCFYYCRLVLAVPYVVILDCPFMLSRSILLCEDTIVWGFPGDSVVKNLPAMQETQVRSLGQEDPPGGGHGNPPQYSCLKTPMDRGAWLATVHRVAVSQTQLE